MQNIVIFLICTCSSFLTGLLGVGGGLIIVPAFLFCLPFFGIDNLSIHQIVGISATCVFLNSFVSVFYRRKEAFLSRQNIFKYAVAIALGTIIGSIASSFAPKNIILWIYVVIASLSLYLMLFKSDIKNQNPKLNFLVYPLFFLIGAVSASIGIGGAVFFATVLNFFTVKNTKELLPTITLLVAIHALFTFTMKLSLGFISAAIIPIAFLASLLGSKVGIIVSRRLSAKTLNILMAIILLLGVVKIILEIYS